MLRLLILPPDTAIMSPWLYTWNQNDGFYNPNINVFSIIMSFLPPSAYQTLSLSYYGRWLKYVIAVECSCLLGPIVSPAIGLSQFQYRDANGYNFYNCRYKSYIVFHVLRVYIDMKKQRYNILFFEIHKNFA